MKKTLENTNPMEEDRRKSLVDRIVNETFEAAAEAMASIRGRELPKAVRKAVDRADEARTHAPRAYERLAAEAGRAVSAAVEDEIGYATGVGLAHSAGGASRVDVEHCAWRLRQLEAEADALGLPLTQARADAWACAVERLSA